MDHWGVDSSTAANTPAPGGGTFWDAVVAMAAVAPDFWGRYIGGRFSLRSAEVAFLHGKPCSIAVFYNGATGHSVSGGQDQGAAEAENAIGAAGVLGIPAGVCIYADIEQSFPVTPDWMRGWATAIGSAGFVPGFYGNPLPGNFFANSYDTAAAADSSVANSLLFSMEREPRSLHCQAGANAPAFNPATPAFPSQTVLWQYTEDCPVAGMPSGTGVDMDIANDAAFAAMWAP